MFCKQYTMLLRTLYCKDSRLFSSMLVQSKYTFNEENLKKLCKYLNITKEKAQYLGLKYPVIRKSDIVQMKNIVELLCDLGFNKNAILEEPYLFSLLPITLKYRHTVLKECGINNITPQILQNYLNIVKQKTIGELKASGLISSNINIENQLASYMTQWPTSITTLVYGNVDDFTLYSLRIKLIQRYLELMLDLTSDEFYRGLHTYPTIKHRPLQTINETLNILQRKILIPNDKIKSNLYLIHSDPDNLNDLLFKLVSIGGINIKEILRLHPKLAMKNYSTMLEIRNILEEYKVSSEAQVRCFQIYTLSPATIRERLENAKSIPEFKMFYNHPRFLKMIHYNTKAMKRIMKLYDNNKTCLSLNILSGSSAHYEVFEKTPGDRLGKGRDLIFCITQALGKSYSASRVRNIMRRHPFWINIPLVQVRFVYEKLAAQFSDNDIYENCPILLYPWNKIRDTVKLLDKQLTSSSPLLFNENVDIHILSKSQKLSLILYLLEKKHYFSGNGVWTEEKHVNIVNVSEFKHSMQNKKYEIYFLVFNFKSYIRILQLLSLLQTTSPAWTTNYRVLGSFLYLYLLQSQTLIYN